MLFGFNLYLLIQEGNNINPNIRTYDGLGIRVAWVYVTLELRDTISIPRLQSPEKKFTVIKIEIEIKFTNRSVCNKGRPLEFRKLGPTSATEKHENLDIL